MVGRSLHRAPESKHSPARRHFLAILSAAAAGAAGLAPGVAQAKVGGNGGALLNLLLGKGKASGPNSGPQGLALGQGKFGDAKSPGNGLAVGLGGQNPGKGLGVGESNPGLGGIGPVSAGGSRGQGPFCLVRGSLIAVPGGERPIEDLRAGDLVRTLDGAAPVRWIGAFSRQLDPLRPDPEVAPIRIARSALDEDTPRRDLYVSPAHGLYIDGYIVPAKDLVNGSTIAYAHAGSLDEVDYVHVLLDQHNVVYAEGAPVETLLIGSGPEHEILRALAGGSMTPIAPNIGYEGGRAHMKALLRLGVSPFVDVRDPLQRIYHRLEQRAALLARRTVEAG